jgi:acetyl-CoA carboxylase biotin carboxyl carrier protein
MSKDANPEGSFDLDRLKKLLQMMEKFGVTEVNLQCETEQWKVRRGPKAAPLMAPLHPMLPGPLPAAPIAPPPAVGGEATPPPAPKGITIDSPTVGTFYASPTPEDPVFVQVGTSVTPDKIVCIVEAMKVFNQIPAEVNGKIVEVLVKSGDPVEFGQPLFRVDPA